MLNETFNETNHYNMDGSFCDNLITNTTYACLIFLNIVFVFSLFIIPIHHLIFKPDRVYIFDIPIRIAVIGVIVYYIFELKYVFTGFTLYDYNNHLYELSFVRGSKKIELLFFFFVLNNDNISLCIQLFLFFGNRTKPNSSNYKSHIKQNNSLCDLEFEEQNAFLISCHNSSDKINETIDSIICKVPRHVVFISDNGSSDIESEKTKKICDIKRVNYLYLKFGNKSKSQFACANHIRSNYTKVKYITCIDDDTHLPPTWDFKHIKEHFDNNIDATTLFIPLVVKNKINFITWCQMLEYLLADHGRMAQAKISSTLFAAGAFSIWKLDYFLEAVVRHNTVFHGDDFQLKMNIQKLYNKPFLTANKIMKNSPKVIVCEHIFVPTIAPVHWFHLWRGIPIFGNFFKSEPCSCGEGSLYEQRSKGWEMSRQRFILEYLSVIFSKGKFCWNTIWIKILYTYEVIMIINDWVGIFYIFIFGIVHGNWDQILRAMLITVSWTTPLIILINFLVLNNFKIPLFVVLMYTLLYKLPMNVIIKIDCMFYNFVIYSTIKNPKRIFEQLQDVEVFNVYCEYWKKYAKFNIKHDEENKEENKESYDEPLKSINNIMDYRININHIL
jgi:hypothetical protein